MFLESFKFAGGNKANDRVWCGDYEFGQSMANPIRFDACGTKIVPTPREMVVNVPVVYCKIFEIFRD